MTDSGITTHCQKCREESDTTFAFAELHYTDFGDGETFRDLAREHGLEYTGQHPQAAPGATSHQWTATDGLSLWTAEDPTRERTESVITADGREERDKTGYASYLFIEGPAAAAESLFRDVVKSAVYIKGEFQPLQTTEGEFIASYTDNR
ncbi:hypothetical protein [Natrinema sp. DC36]|uniref:hypothetical protein n=1 Tax=Natrinema sp. DC36 TaxID=2878680 RepID=UPI001CF08228|nr:hypothetical protein [Natrinema sp. DC36]